MNEYKVDNLDGFVLLNKKSLGEFKEILKVLNRYFESINPASKGLEFRKNLAFIKGGEVWIKFIGDYQYHIMAKLTKNDEFTNWIHIDGIAEERKQMKERGIKEHPVFNITCVGDLYESSLKKTKRKVA